MEKKPSISSEELADLAVFVADGCRRASQLFEDGEVEEAIVTMEIIVEAVLPYQDAVNEKLGNLHGIDYSKVH